MFDIWRVVSSNIYTVLASSRFAASNHSHSALYVCNVPHDQSHPTPTAERNKQLKKEVNTWHCQALIHSMFAPSIYAESFLYIWSSWLATVEYNASIVRYSSEWSRTEIADETASCRRNMIMLDALTYQLSRGEYQNIRHLITPIREDSCFRSSSLQ